MNPGQAKGIFLQTSLGDYAKVLLSRIALSKLYGTANYNSIEDPLLTNPFWARDAIYATPIRTKTFADMVRFTINAGVILDEEADVRDPDAPGSVNTIDERDAVTAVAARFFGVNTSLTAELVGFDAGDGVQRHREVQRELVVQLRGPRRESAPRRRVDPDDDHRREHGRDRAHEGLLAVAR